RVAAQGTAAGQGKWGAKPMRRGPLAFLPPLLVSGACAAPPGPPSASSPGAAPPPAPTLTPGRASENPEDVRAREARRPTPFLETKCPPPQQSAEAEPPQSNSPVEPERLRAERP